MEAPLRASYDAAAQVFADSGESLSEETLISRIPVLLFEVALEFRWVTREEAERSSFCWSQPAKYGKPLVFPDPAASLGSYKVPVESDAAGWTAQEKKRVLQSIGKSRAK
jgi:hypothetical protein